MTFDPSAIWLLCITTKEVLYIIPALSLMEETQAHIFESWKLDELTRIRQKKRRGQPTCLVWWQTFNHDPVAVIGTKLGFVLFIDLRSERLLAESDVNEHVTNVELLHGDTQMTTHALITSKNNNQWVLLLEMRNDTDSSKQRTEIGFESVSVNILHHPETQANNFQLKQVNQFSHATLLSRVLTNMVAVRDFEAKQLEIYGKLLDASPQYIFNVPELMNDFLDLKEAVIQTFMLDPNERIVTIFKRSFPSDWHERQTEKVDGIEDTMATEQPASEEKQPVSQEYHFLEQKQAPQPEDGSFTGKEGKDSEHQEQSAHVQPRERLQVDGQDMMQRTIDGHDTEEVQEQAKQPTSSKQPTETTKKRCSLKDFEISTQTVLEGCVVITTQNVYECRPRISPEALFLELVVLKSDLLAAERLTTGLLLHIDSLYRLAARVHLRRREYGRAARYFRLGKTPHVERMETFMKLGLLPDVPGDLPATVDPSTTDITQSTGRPPGSHQDSGGFLGDSTCTGIEDSEKQCLAAEKIPLYARTSPGFSRERPLDDLILLVYVQQLLDDKSGSEELSLQLREFLETNCQYSKREALEVLVDQGLHEMALFLGKVKDCYIEVLERLVAVAGATSPLLKVALHSLPHSSLRMLIKSPLIDHMLPEDLVAMLEVQPTLALNFVSHFSSIIYQLNSDLLLKVTSIFDPSLPTYQLLRDNSDTNPKDIRNTTSKQNIILESTQESQEPLSKLIDLFTKCVILLNSIRDDDITLSFTDTSFIPKHAKLLPPEDSIQFRLNGRQSVLSAGHHQTAMVHGGQLYVWGDCFRKERSELETTESAEFWRPYTPAALTDINVTSVSCGAHHSIALTTQGVYAWGDCRFGQLGIGQSVTDGFVAPTRVKDLDSVSCVDVHCGHYHSVVLMEDASVWTWGWGIHGQLGHGDTLDCHVPTLMTAMQGKYVLGIAAGYAHTLLRTLSGEVYACGNGVFGQLGLGVPCKRSRPRCIPNLPANVISISTKDFQCLAATNDGRVYQWGASPNQLYELVRDQRQGRPRLTPPAQRSPQIQAYLSPVPVNCEGVFAGVAQVHCGSNFSALLTKSGEVFTWGKNLDGQLGIGNRNEQFRSPVMVNRINDRRVAALTCGAEHMVAMDTERQMWAWGRNDQGQLAVVTSQGSHASHGRQGIYVSMGIYAAVWPTKVPSLNRLTQDNQPAALAGRPAKPHYSPLRVPDGLLETEGQWQSVLPPLAPYSCDSIFILLQHLPAHCDVDQWLQQSVDHQLWATAGSVALQSRALALALHCHLQALQRNREGFACIAEKLVLIAEFYLNELEDLGASRGANQTQAVQDVICQLAEAWMKYAVDITSFMDQISKHLSLVAWPFFLLMTRTSQADSDSSESPTKKPSPLTLPAELLSKLTTSFCLEVTTYVVQLIEQDGAPPPAGNSPRQAHLRMMGHDSLEVLGLMPARRLGSPTKLWEEVLQNLQPATEAADAITLTPSEMQALAASSQAAGEVGETSIASIKAELEHNPPAVVFSCGHHFARVALLEEASKDLKQELIGSGMLHSASLLGSHYAYRGVLAVACPHCVLSTIRTS